MLKAKHLVGSLQVARFTVMKEDLPDDVKEEPTDPPRFGTMVVTAGPGGETHICIPAAPTQKWCNHPVFGVRSQSFMDSFGEEQPSL